VTSRRQFVEECGKAAAAFVFMAACDQERIAAASKPRPLAMGVSVMTCWASPRPEYGLVTGCQCPVEWPWEAMRATNRVPAIGQYDEAKPEVTSWRIEQMTRGGIDWCSYQHEWSFHLGKLVMNHCAENHPADSAVSFAMSWWDVQSAATDSLNLKYWDSTYWTDGRLPIWTRENISAGLIAYGRACAPIMAKASYLRIDDRPVLFRGYANTLQFYADRFGISPKEVLDLIAEGVGERPYFVATSCDPTVYPALKSWGFDALTEYQLNSDSWAHVLNIYRDRWASGLRVAKATGLHYWVPATAGFDARGYRPDSDAVRLGYTEPPTPADFTAHLIEARDIAERNYDLTQGRVITGAWSEHYEGSILEPQMPGMLHDGDEMLLAHRAACNPPATAYLKRAA
jgi:hypothetical protein